MLTVSKVLILRATAMKEDIVWPSQSQPAAVRARWPASPPRCACGRETLCSAGREGQLVEIRGAGGSLQHHGQLRRLRAPRGGASHPSLGSSAWGRARWARAGDASARFVSRGTAAHAPPGFQLHITSEKRRRRKRLSCPFTADGSCKTSLLRNAISRQLLSPNMSRPSSRRCTARSAGSEASSGCRRVAVASLYSTDPSRSANVNPRSLCP